MYDSNHRLTLDGMRQVLAEGGTVMHRGNIINKPESLPSAAMELAAGDEKATADALKGLDEQERQLAKQRERLLAENARIAKSREEAAQREKAEQAATAKQQQQQPPAKPAPAAAPK